MGAFFDEIRTRANIETAARWVCSRGQQSRSSEIRAEVDKFRRNWTGRILGLQAKLRADKFRFELQRVVFVPRPRKKPRPIIIAPIGNRIVQRAILQVLQGSAAAGTSGVEGIRDTLAIATSVGGIEGIDAGIALVVEAIRTGAKWQITSDIPNFFTRIPIPPVLEFIRASSGDDELTALVGRAIETTLANADKLTVDECALLPIDDTGVAQGSALSALAGNILLREFDRQLQGHGVRCVRYIDDFIILADSRRRAEGAFRSAQRTLATMGITAYEPGDRSGKAFSGAVSGGVEFLGCRIDGTLVAPRQKAREALLTNIRDLLAEGRASIRRAVAGEWSALRGSREAQVLRHVDLVVNGWGQAFRFCNATHALTALDKEIQQMVQRFRAGNAKLAASLSDAERARVAGITRLVDIPRQELSLSPRAAGLSHPSCPPA